MHRRRLSLAALAAALLTVALAPAARAATAPQPLAQPQLVASFAHQVTGVTVTRSGRTFVNFPRWTEDSPVSVAEVLPDGTTRPYPDAGWNGWRNATRPNVDPATHFVTVQSVVARGDDLWVLDPAAPAMGPTVPRGPKLVRVDTRTDEVTKVIRIGPRVAPSSSYLNDVRFSADGRWAYITDSGAKGALVVVDTRSGSARRVLNGAASTQPEPDVVVQTDGAPLRRPDGRAPMFSADGIALSPDGRTLYWQALTGRTLWSVPTRALRSRTLTARALRTRVQRVGRNDVADGLWIDGSGAMYVTDPQRDQVRVRAGGRTGVRAGDTLAPFVQSPLLRWPDTLAEGPDGALYVTTSRIQDSAFFKPAAPIALQTQLWRIGTAGTP